MRGVWVTLSWRLPVVALLAGLLWRAWGAVGLVMASAPIALALARPLQDLLGGSWRQVAHLATGHALRGTRHYRGHTLAVVEDAEHRLWLRVDDLRRVLDGLPPDARLRAACGAGCAGGSWRVPLHVEAQGLIDLLAAARERPTLRFVEWLRQELAADQRRRERGLSTTPR